MNAATVILALFIIAPDGTYRQDLQPRATLDRCFADARAFVRRDPAEFEGAAALGAGCIVQRLPGRQS